MDWWSDCFGGAREVPLGNFAKELLRISRPLPSHASPGGGGGEPLPLPSGEALLRVLRCMLELPDEGGGRIRIAAAGEGAAGEGEGEGEGERGNRRSGADNSNPFATPSHLLVGRQAVGVFLARFGPEDVAVAKAAAVDSDEEEGAKRSAPVRTAPTVGVQNGASRRTSSAGGAVAITTAYPVVGIPAAMSRASAPSAARTITPRHTMTSMKK